MKVLIAEHSGFCQGVKRAVDIADQLLSDIKPGQNCFSLGPIIHNPQVVDQLAARGLKVVNDLEMLRQDDIVLIRSHGAGPKIWEQAAAKQIKIVDATCTFVRHVQQKARELIDAGYKLVIIGDKDHPEVIGLQGWARHKAVVINEPRQIKMYDLSGKVAVIAQTTYSSKQFDELTGLIKEINPLVLIKKTTCPATEERQYSAEKLADRVEAMVVIGGRNSSNTAKLTQLCKKAGVPTYQIETAGELQPKWFKNIQVAGITAGASTPDWIIEGVVESMSEFNEFEVNQEEIEQEEVAAEATEPAEPQEAEAEATAAEEPVVEPAEEDEESVAMLQAQEMEIKTLNEGDVITGIVVKISNDEVLVDIGAKSEGIIPVKELSSFNIASPNDVVAVGDEIEVLVTKAEDEDGKVWLSKKRVDARKLWINMEEKKEADETITGTVKEQVKGGLIVDVGLRAFLPASQVSVKYVEDLGEYVGQEIQVKIIEIDKNKNKLIVSRKAFLQEEAMAKREELLNSLEVGQIVEGEVKRIAKFGAFIDLGGIDGLLHISEMSWHRIADPSEVVSVGQKLQVKILKLDQEKERISLGLKQVLPNPWETIFERYNEGDIVDAKVLRMASFGVFVQLEPGIEGLVHISHLTDHHVAECSDAVSIGDVVRVKILSIMQSEKKMRLSIKEAVREEGPAPETEAIESDAEEASAEEIAPEETAAAEPVAEETPDSDEAEAPAAEEATEE